MQFQAFFLRMPNRIPNTNVLTNEHGMTPPGYALKQITLSLDRVVP